MAEKIALPKRYDPDTDEEFQALLQRLRQMPMPDDDDEDALREYERLAAGTRLETTGDWSIISRTAYAIEGVDNEFDYIEKIESQPYKYQDMIASDLWQRRKRDCMADPRYRDKCLASPFFADVADCA